MLTEAARRQQEVMDYLRDKNQILREKLGPKRILPSTEQNRHVATKGKMLRGELLGQFGRLFCLDMIVNTSTHSAPAITNKLGFGVAVF